MRVLGRLVVVPLALMFAALAALFMLVTIGQERVVAALGGEPIEANVVLAGLEIALRIGVVALSVQTLLPVILLIVAGEIAHIRGPLYYVVGGGIALGLIPLLAGIGRGPASPALAGLWTVFATAGFAGGFVYWLFAGRRA
jgi:hypothetical protein